MKKLMLLMVVVLLVPLLAACAQPAVKGEVKSDIPYQTSPDVPLTDEAQLVRDNNAFALQLFQQLAGEDGNIFCSPYSISLALAMAYAGARGETEQEMKNVLHFNLDQAALHPAFNKLNLELASRGQGAKGKDDQGFRLNIVNAIWGQQDYAFLPDYLNLLAQNYDAGLRTLDFIKQTEAARQAINDWVDEQTEGRIKDLIPQGAIDGMTRLVLTNAVYFNAAWQSQFNEKNTRNEAFNLLDGGTVTVPMMHQTTEFNYAAGDDYQAVELPYDGHELSMVVILPAEDKFTDFEGTLDAARLDNILNGLDFRSVNLAMPKFEFRSEFSLADTLDAMGMPQAFNSQADFSGMNGNYELYISAVLHKAFVSVDENGTEAAAATAVILSAKGMPAQTATLTLDRPFLFLIRDMQTGQIIFIGRVLNPAQ